GDISVSFCGGVCEARTERKQKNLSAERHFCSSCWCFAFQLTPSAFLKEMSLTTEQRLASTREMRRPRITQLLDMGETSHHKFSAVDLEESLFQPFPSEVVFQNYVPFEVYEVPLILRNIDQVSQLVKVVLETSPYFKLTSPSGVCCNVAPGMCSTFHIQFTPEENKDYFYQLTCITEREKFIVPIRAIGARAILDFPDQLNFSICPVKYSSQKTLLVRNIGNREARYCISTESPFSVDPSIGTLGIGDAMQVTVEFHPLKTGDHSSSLVVHYDTGEDIHTSLYGAAVDVNIGLARSSLTIEKTYLTLSNHRSVVIHNRSEIIVHFQWKAFVTQEEEDHQKLRQKEDEMDPCLRESKVDPALPERLSLLSHPFQDQRAKAQGDSMLSSDNLFTLEPLEGDIWPNSSAEINVIFRPREARVYQQTVYCDISAIRKKRRFLMYFPFAFLLLQVVLFNKGAIDAVFNLVPPATALGSCFTFLPQEGIILPDGLQVIRISFSSTILGEFTEEFRFSVNGSSEPVNLTVRGCVIGPTFHFDVPALHFGDVSFGFPHTLSCRLTNTSLVPLTFNLRIPGDGLGEPSVSSSVQMSDNTLPLQRKGAQPRLRSTEFTIKPCRGTIRPLGFLDIQVTLCSNTVKSYELALVVDVCGVGKAVSALLLTARCVVPPLRVLNPVVMFGRCFLKFPYQQMLTLVNDSDLPGCYRVLPQEDASVWYSSPVPWGTVQPRSSVEVPLTLEAQVTGQQDTVAHVAVFGSEGSPLVMSTGEGPVVYVHPSKINFSSIQVLQDASRPLHLSNQSVIPASFRAEMAGKCSRWRIEPSEGVIPPETEVSVAVIANLDDMEKFKDEVNLFIENSHTYVIPVRAVGIGTTIVIDKPFAPELNLGPHFSLDPCCYHFKITNKGRRTHRLYWSTEGFGPFRQRDRVPAVSTTKGHGFSQSPSPACPVFKVQPLRMELMPGKTMEMVLEGFSSTPQVVKERLLCHAVVGSRAGKAPIMQVDVTCEFIAPVLQMSSREITFRVEKQPSDVLTLQYQPLSLKNTSSLPLSIVLALEQPFLVCDTDQQPLSAGAQPVKLEIGEELHLSIRFNPDYEKDLCTRVVEKVLKIQFLEHPHEERVMVRGEVYFPNLHIQPMALDFGCILNDTEGVRYVEMTNCSPLLAQYHWSFLMDSHVSQMRYVPLCSLLEALLLPRVLFVLCKDQGCLPVFDVLPLYGVLRPGESQRVMFTFFGHTNIVAHVMALCRVEGGPTYKIALSGEASLISYILDVTEIDCGLQLFNKVTEAEVTLQNSGKMGFTYVVLRPSAGTADSPLPGVPLVLPSTVSTEEQVLKVYYLPGVPGAFCRTFQIQVGHLEPEEISLKGVGSFPRIHLDLPRNIKGEHGLSAPQEGPFFLPHQMLIEEHALEQQKALTSGPPEATAFDQHARQRLLKAELPEYLLDFGYVILGNTPTHVVRITNTGQFPVSFRADRRVLRDTGFSVDLDYVKHLLCCKTKVFEVRFDPQSANLPLGEVDVLLPIKVAGGPTFHVRLHASVAVPSLCVSRDRLEFSTLQCGQCQEETVQLHNQLQVPCNWLITINEPKLKAQPCVFEALPSAGALAPGQRCNVRVRFSPTEEKFYRSQLKINIYQSSQHLQLQVSGRGLEPQLEFSPTVLELGPLLPYSCGAEGTVVVKNPCEFPIEFYSLEFDQQYLAEEQILQTLKDYDCHNTLLLPPRAPGEKLPPEVLEYYQDQKRLQDEQTKSKTGEPAGQDNGEGLALAVLSVDAAGSPARTSERPGRFSPVLPDEHLFPQELLGNLSLKMVHVQVSPSALPLSQGKTAAAVALSKYYGAACLSMDTVVTEAISDGSSWAGLRARELCIGAAIEQSCQEAEGAGEEKRWTQRSLQKPTVSAAAGKKKTDGPTPQSQKQHLMDLTGSQVNSHLSPLPCVPAQQWLSTSGSTSGELGFRSCVLPEDLLVAILSERLQLSDCYQGVVFDGLETPFACNTASALLCLLKAVRNRPYIYFVNLFQDYASLKAREMAAKEQEGREREEAARREEARLWEMEEDEYDALTEEEKIQFDNSLRQVQRERKKRSMEQLAPELEEKHQRELERLREEEELKKLSKWGKRKLGKDKDNASRKKSQPGVSNTSASIGNLSDVTEGGEKKGSAKEHPDSLASDKEDKKKQSKAPLTEACPVEVVQPTDPEQGETKTEEQSDSENLALRFKSYEASQKDVTHILSSWDRAQGILLSPLNQDVVQHQVQGQRQHLSRRRSQKHREKERLEKLKALEKLSELEGEGAEGSARGQDVGVPCLDIQVLSSADVTRAILESGKLPAAEQILDELGLGPSGPPIPPTAFYSVIHYPEKRMVPAAGEALEHFAFVVPEGATAEEGKDTGSSLDVPVVPAVSQEQVTPSRGRSGKEKAAGRQEAVRQKQSSSRGRRGLQPPPSLVCSLAMSEASSLIARLSSCRWIVPAHGEVELKGQFSSTVPGQFDQTLHFEVLGTKRLYQVHCRGTCLYPTISQDPRLVFPRQRKSKVDDDIIFKQYVMNTGVFHFGPLLCGKSRDWYKAKQFPSNCEKITILNITPLEAEVHFSFEHDLKADTFLLDPPSMRLKANEKQELSVWAYPTSAGLVEDNLICRIKGNPEPVVFRLCCQGVQVELGVSPKQVHFNKLLLHRSTLVLQNRTPLPVAWRLSGLENFGEDFAVSHEEGVVGPRTEFGVHLYFKATQALSIKKTIRLEVSDAENVLGIAQVENIQIFAEAYDVALSINISKGADGSVDFGILKVLDETKQVLTLKNKGKYEIAYSFKLETADTNIPDLASHFTVQPQKGVLTVSKHLVQVQLLFHPKTETVLCCIYQPLLRLQVIEPSTCEEGETIAIIPVRVSAKAVFSKYSIYPASFINFGALVNGSRTTCTFMLENNGTLDFKFLIYRADRDAAVSPRKSAHRRKSACSHESENLSKMTPSVEQSKHSLQKDANPFMQARFTLGMFTVYPGSGSIPPGGQQVITVDCYAKGLGTCKEHLSIDISDRDPKDNPLGIPYTLFAESCLPAFVVDDIESIFEEHRICSSINLCHILQTVQDKGVFITDENKFIFTNVLVGHRATARFKIRNVGKVPCDVVLSIKPIRGQMNKTLNSHISDIFKVDPIRMGVPSRSHAFATVTFTPQTMQNYQCTFEASLDVQASLTFNISGDGNLPQVTVLRPVLHNKSGNPLLLFKKLLLGDSEKLPLVLHNSGIVPVQLMIDLLDEGGVFFLKARPTTHCIYQAAGMEEDASGEESKPHTTSLVLHRGESAEFDVLFKPTLAQCVEGRIHLSVVDNPYEETNIHLVGEGYEDDFTLDNIHGQMANSEEENTEGNLEEDIIEDPLLLFLTAARVDHIQFGDCSIGAPHTVSFIITNRSRAETMRFEWLAGAPFHFSPQVGHLHAGCAKDITVTLRSDVAVAFRKHPVRCEVARIALQLPPEQVPDWDDCLRTVKWVDATRGPAATWPVKKKVVETDPEPAHTVLEKSIREVELRLSAVVDYAEFELKTDTIEFEETLLFQTRMFTFQLSNTGNVALEYTWMVAVEDERAVSRAGELHCSSQLGCALEQVSFSLSSSLNTISDTPPFSVEPRSGTIPAGQEQLFQMKFSPVHVGDFDSRMLCSIPNLRPNQKGPEVAVKGRSLMPLCHFELEDSDYITAKRRVPELQGPKGASLDLNTRVIEFESFLICVPRTFMVMNPTSSTYSFQWTCQDPEAPPEQVAFFCRTERGRLQPGKQAEMKFEFIPGHLGITESFWAFTVPEQSISVPFLLVGNTTDPLVTLDRSHLNFQSLLIGHEVHQTITIINSEKEAFSFAFRESSLFSEGCNASMKIEPLEGSIAPLSRFPITVFFTPTLEGEVVFNLKCDVKRKTQPLSLNIKATGYSVHTSVRCEDSDGCVTELSAQEINVIDFKEVQLNENVQHLFSIHNNSKFSFTFSWQLSGPAACKQVLTVTPQTGVVQAEGKAETQLAFHPQKMCSLKDVELTLQINKGPTFTCVFLAAVVVPTVHFSTTRLNFGTCFIYHAGMAPSCQTLVITNQADKDVSLSCLFTSTAHLHVDFPGYVLRPGGTVEVPITFYPREVASYHELIPFEINGLCQQTIEVRGRGMEMKVDVVEPQGKVVKLGALSIGQTVKKIVTIANNSAAPLTFKLSLKSTMPELQEAGVLCLKPTNELSLKPKGETCKVEVTFSPKCRIQPFAEEVMLECSGLVRSLFAVRGSCQGTHVSLDQEHLSFGAVAQQSYTSRHLTMQNTGDIGVKFKWDIKSFKPDFSISPTKGYISPGMDVPFVVTFHPSKLSRAIQCEGLQCFVEGSEPLRLTLAGCCTETPVSKETLTFTCAVREKHSQTILLSNPSNKDCTVQAVIEGQHWKGPEFFHLEASQQNKPYTITYEPLTMSSENKKHQGSLYFPLPDGTGLYYLLQGTAETPKCSGTILQQVPCRNSYTELIPVSNWLNRPQRFLVVVDMLKPENLESSSVLQGLEYIDVPGSAKKDYKLTFLSYKEGVFNAMVTFLNEVTKEYLFYMVTFKATASGPISTVEVTTAVRQRASATVKVDNPLPVPVTFAVGCKVPDISVPPQFTVPAQSEADLVFEYQPLKVGESTGRLVLRSSDLGSFYYNLHLKATVSGPEEPLYFCTTLGSSQTITTKIMNYARQKTNYHLQTNCADFLTEKTISVAPASLGGSEVSVDVTFEPCQLGEARAVLQLSSLLGGEYSIPLFGLALPPKSQGPFPIQAGGSTSLPFKNIFLQPMAFQYRVEHPAFTLRAPETLCSKQTTSLSVSFECGLAPDAAPVTSKMVVSCPGAGGVSWVYYLRGLPPPR
uniref:HYDIN protein n=1 Tax=Otus sunia TaxID=257818 RepID=A0A8C8B419_9STRI